MICKGKPRSEGAQLAAYLADYLLGREKNERSELLELTGSQYQDLHRAIRGWEAEAAGSYCRKPLWHAQICPAPGETLTREQKLEAVMILERHLGFDRQARAVIVHQKEGHEHIHIVWSRMDRATGKAKRDDFTHKKNAAAAREIEERFDLRHVDNPFAQDRSARTRREKRTDSRARPTQSHWEQHRRSGLDAAARKEEITRLWQTTDCGKAFRLALEEAGYTLARGDRRGWCIVDRAGEVHSLPRQITGAVLKDVEARFGDLDPRTIPDVAAVRAMQREASREGAAKRIRRRRHAAPEVDAKRTHQGEASTPQTQVDKSALPDAAAVLEALTKSHSTFTVANLSRHLRSHGLPETLAAQVRTHPDLIALGLDRQAVPRFTTRATLEMELSMEAAAGELADRPGHRVKDKIRKAAPSATALNGGQVQALAHVLGEQDLALVIGYAGTGKSTMLGAAREAWEAQGYRVHGVALSGIAAASLERGSAISSRTLHSLFYRMENAGKRAEAIATLDSHLVGLQPGRQKAALTAERSRLQVELDSCTLGKRDVLVVDEAGMIGSCMMERLLTTAAKAGAKVVLVGDTEQLQAIDAGGAFRALWERHGAAEITEVKRQRQDWQCEATQELATGRTVAALERYREAGRIHAAGTQEEAREALITGWSQTRREAPGLSQIMLAYTRADVADLNGQGRAAFRAEGRLGVDMELETSTGTQVFAKGDRLYFTRNDTRLGVKNGTLGTVESIRNGLLTVAVDGAGSVSFDIADYGFIAHGYAATVHKSQGVTVDRAQVLVSRYMDRHAAYVALSRHRDQVELHYARDQMGGFDELTRTLSRDGRKDTTLDYVRRADQGIPVPERFKRTVNAIWQALTGLVRLALPEAVPKQAAAEPSPVRPDRLSEFLGIKPEGQTPSSSVQESQRDLSSKLRDFLRRGQGNTPGQTL